MKKVKLIEVQSEIAAGTRGASTGIWAMKVASLNAGSDFFSKYESQSLDNENELLFEGNKFEWGKHIDGVHTMLERVADGVASTLKNGEFPVILAGDHSTAAGTICGIKKANPDARIGAVWIDAHADLHSPYTTPTGNMHGMPLAMVAGIDNLESQRNEPTEEVKEYWDKIKNVGADGPKISTDDIVFICVRDTEKPEDDLMERNNIKNFDIDEIRAKGAEKVASETLERLGNCDLIYISFDVDSMDASISRGTGTPVENGLSVKEAKEINELLVKSLKVCAWEIVEVNPTLDDKINTMAENAFAILQNTTDTLEERLKS